MASFGWLLRGTLFFFVVFTVATGHPAKVVTKIQSGYVTWKFTPNIFQLDARRGNDSVVMVSKGTDNVFSSRVDEDGWFHWPTRRLKMKFTPVSDDGLRVEVNAEIPQEFTWPSIEVNAGDNLIWPRGEGLVVPASDPFWHKEIFEREWNVAESLSLPLWGIQRNGQIVSWFTESPFRNTIKFSKSNDGFRLQVHQEFTTKSEQMRVAYHLFLDKSHDPIRPANHYREFLENTRQLITLEEKTQETSSVDLLRGAAHAYLWGDDLVGGTDIPQSQWRAFCRELLSDAISGDNFAAFLKSAFTDEQWQAVQELSKAEWPYQYAIDQVCTGLSTALRNKGSFATAARRTTLAQTEKAPKPSGVPTIQKNMLLLQGAYPEYFLPVPEWSHGGYSAMFKAFQEAGLDHLKLCTPDHGALGGRPWVAEIAKQNGWLIGTYDSYHSIHSPRAKPDSTWSTAQMTSALYENGAIVAEDGSFVSGFRGFGRKLNSQVGRPFVEDRVTSNMQSIPYNYYFVDCDATGEIYDDFHPSHPMSRKQDAAARLDRLRWISETFNVVVGSEGGNAFAVPNIHVAEGVFGPFFGWDETAMKDRKSPFFRGRYYPPNAPDVFFKPIPLMDRFKKLFYNPTYKIPLYATVFHDCVVSTHHWNNGHFKYLEVQNVTALSELLYLAPPMYHFDVTEFQKRKIQVQKHYEVWSPLHKKYGFEKLTSFQFLTDDHTVQQTRFGNNCEITVNFGASTYQAEQQAIPSMSALINAPAIWGEPMLYTAK